MLAQQFLTIICSIAMGLNFSLSSSSHSTGTLYLTSALHHDRRDSVDKKARVVPLEDIQTEDHTKTEQCWSFGWQKVFHLFPGESASHSDLSTIKLIDYPGQHKARPQKAYTPNSHSSIIMMDRGHGHN